MRARVYCRYRQFEYANDYRRTGSLDDNAVFEDKFDGAEMTFSAKASSTKSELVLSPCSSMRRYL